MELKPYQEATLNDLKSYLEKLKETSSLEDAFREFWSDKIPEDLFFTYKNTITNVPNVCIKVPTAGGKTFIACNSLQILFSYFKTDYKTVIWLVPSVSILEQTYKNLSNINHAYRQKLNLHFQSRVEIFNKDKILNGIGFSPTRIVNQLNIIILSFDSLRTKKIEGRKIYQENSQIASFTNLKNPSVETLEGTDETALINVIRKLNPILIVDESHNAESELSIEMLKNLNPSFILDFTATPKNYSNIISYANVFELKKENMVKLPVVVYNHQDRTELFIATKQLRDKLEQDAIEEEKINHKYIRPIVLFLAQSKSNEDSITFEKIKEKLISMKIPENEIKIKTANNDELKGIDLLSRECQVRYIITIDALKEGWDCHFAYILSSIADKNSDILVEQTLGRILRLPYTTKHSKPLLNMSFVMTSSNKFNEVIQRITEAMNYAGYGSSANIKPKDFSSTIKPVEKDLFVKNESDTFEDVNVEKINNANQQIETEIIRFAEDKIIEIEKESKSETQGNQNYNLPQDLIKKLPNMEINKNYKNQIIDLKLPKFHLKHEDDLGLFGFNETEFKKENLLNDFKLSSCDTKINFQEVEVDAKIGDVVSHNDKPKFEFARLQKDSLEKFQELILNSPKEKKIRELVAFVQSYLGKKEPIKAREIEKYLNHVFEDFTSEQIIDCMEKIHFYVNQINKKIDSLSTEFVKKKFLHLLEIDKIFLKETYSIPLQQSLGDIHDYGIQKSFFLKEYKMNELEKNIISRIAELDSVLAWTKNEVKKGFFINGFINHYPDFLVITKKGKILAVETKGSHLDNTDSILKLELGKKWADKAGAKFKYFMIFVSDKLDGSYSVEEALELIKSL